MSIAHCVNRLDDLKADDDNGFLTSRDTTPLLLTGAKAEEAEMPGPGAQLGPLYPPPDGMESDGGGLGGGGDPAQPRNPLTCYLCNEYYSDPCLLQCFHTFCMKCLRGREVDGRISCPLCGNLTSLKDNSVFPPADNLMKQLVELVNAENPPCANCDKRDKTSMFFCSTCGQSLCHQCRENTHRAKMFSSHDIMHMSKCVKDSQKKCPIHGEIFIMFNNVQKSMLCVTCFRDAPNETRMHCIDIDAAYTQTSKKLDRVVITLCEVQNSVREGLLMFKTHLEELRHNMDCEKHTINTFCQGMQDSIAKTHSNMLMEVQRQYETKERSFRGQLVNLGIILPVIQMHLVLCQSFTNIANKFQFLDLANPMIERLSAITHLSQPQRPIQSSHVKTNYRNELAQCLEPWIGKTAQAVIRVPPPQHEAAAVLDQLNALSHCTSTPSNVQPSKRQQNALRTKAMEGEGPFSNHCRSFDSQIKELSQQLSLVKEHLNDLHRDVSLLRRAQTPPLSSRYNRITADCSILEEQLERHQVELERMKNVFDTLWQEQLCRIHVEQDIFQSQTNEIVSLRAEVKHLATVAQQLEPYVKSLTNIHVSQTGLNKMQEQKIPSSQQMQEMGVHSQQLQNLLDHINALQLDNNKFLSQSITSPTRPKTINYQKDGRERTRPKTPSQSPSAAGGTILDSGRNVIYESQKGITEGGGDKRGVFSQLIDKVRTKDDRKKSLDDRDRIHHIRDKGKVTEIGSRGRSDDQQVAQKSSGGGGKGKIKKEGRHARDGKASSVYQSISGRVLGTKGDSSHIDAGDFKHDSHLPPPPPPVRRVPQQDKGMDIREKLESHLKEKLQEMGSRGSLVHPGKRHISRIDKSRSLEAEIAEDYQRISEAMSCSTESIKTRVLVHRDPQMKQTGSSSTSPGGQDRRSRDRSVEKDRSKERRDKRDRSRDGRDKSWESRDSRDRSREERDKARSREGRERSRERRVRRDKFGRCYPASDTEDNIFYRNGVAGKQNSFDSLTLSPVSASSRKSSADLEDRKTLVLVIGNRKGSSKQRLSQKQRSWETFPPKKKNYDSEYYGGRSYRSSGHNGRAVSVQDGRYSLERKSKSKDKNRDPPEGVLRKADSFEGHEEAVRTLVAAVHQTRSHQMQQSKKMKSIGGHVSN
ncbi:hypothetical protein RUM43_003051 [Polyplax serrata]|uniref:RING finger protein 207 n=1 Tax=Polyplax serrata TaxID=468196 RepID=A0AAN8NUM9_POLSC